MSIPFKYHLYAVMGRQRHLWRLTVHRSFELASALSPVLEELSAIGIHKKMSPIFGLAVLISSAIANMAQCPEGYVRFPLNGQNSGTWPTESLSQLEPLGQNSNCFLQFVPPLFTILYQTFNISNVSDKTIYFSNLLIDEILIGTAVKNFISSDFVGITISPSPVVGDAAFALSYEYRKAPTPTENIVVGTRDFQQLNFNTRKTDQSTKISSKNTDDTIVFLAYYNQDSWDYDSSDCLSFFNQTQLLTSGYRIVSRNGGIWVTDNTEFTMFSSPIPGFHPIIGFYGYKTPKDADVSWPDYKAKAWEAKSYEMNSATERIYVFMREDATKVGVISNIVSKNDQFADGIIEIYEGVGEVYRNNTVFGTLVARFNTTTKAPTTLPGLTYTFCVKKGIVAFDLYEVSSPRSVVPTTPEIMIPSVTSPKSGSKPAGVNHKSSQRFYVDLPGRNNFFV
ncbi:unnamed protein product [Caenorhabditis auriculariae]|uniref:Uncharacterized protein n=1 Tax=Caenorhabditis auriculariae TaxID=2777116 RepID=A0A8S1HS82_9PELO|nr:unnamed protein product [Caenorhabditis auriculariae]